MWAVVDDSDDTTVTFPAAAAVAGVGDITPVQSRDAFDAQGILCYFAVPGELAASKSTEYRSK